MTSARPDEVDEYGFPVSREQWRQFRDTQYIVSTGGRVFDNARGVELNPRNRGGKYMAVDMRVDGERKTMYLHRLVLETFMGPCPPGMEGCHGDGDPGNNALSNLRWDTKEANAADTMEAGNHVATGKLDGADRLAMWVMNERLGIGQIEIASKFDVEQSSVSYAIRMMKGELENAWKKDEAGRSTGHGEDDQAGDVGAESRVEVRVRRPDDLLDDEDCGG